MSDRPGTQHVAAPQRPPKRQIRPLALINARLVDPAGNRDETGGVLVEDGMIRDLGPQVTRTGLPPFGFMPAGSRRQIRSATSRWTKLAVPSSHGWATDLPRTRK